MEAFFIMLPPDGDCSPQPADGNYTLYFCSPQPADGNYTLYFCPHSLPTAITPRILFPTACRRQLHLVFCFPQPADGNYTLYFVPHSLLTIITPCILFPTACRRQLHFIFSSASSKESKAKQRNAAIRFANLPNFLILAICYYKIGAASDAARII